MKKFIWLLLSVFLLTGNIVKAEGEIDFLNLSAYSEGDRPSYGENVIVAQSEETGKKWLTGTQGADIGKLNYLANLHGDFEISIASYMDYYSEAEFLLIAGDEHKIKISAHRSNVQLHANNIRAGSDQSDAFQSSKINNITLKVTNNIAKLYINDIFSQKISLQPDLIFTQVFVQNLGTKDALYEFTANGTVDVKDTSTPSTGTPTSSGCMASYSNGELNIPSVLVLDPFGAATVYSLKMIQQPNTFTFDLDMGSVKKN